MGYVLFIAGVFIVLGALGVNVAAMSLTAGVAGVIFGIGCQNIVADILIAMRDLFVRYLKAGGVLIYSTCTLNKKENEKVVATFLSEHGNFRPDEEKTVFPTPDGGDGFYYARLIKNED